VEKNGACPIFLAFLTQNYDRICGLLGVIARPFSPPIETRFPFRTVLSKQDEFNLIKLCKEETIR